MYRFSRSIYRELAPDILEDRPGHCGPSNHERVLRACEAAVYRLGTDWHYFARPTKTLFNDIRIYFPICSQERVYRVVDRYMTFAQGLLLLVAAERLRRRGQPDRMPGDDAARHALPAHAAAGQRLLPVAPAPGRAGGAPARRVRSAPWPGWASSGWASWGRARRPTCARAGFELTVFNRTRERAEACAGEHGAHVAADAARGRRAQRHRHHDGRRRRRRSSRCCSATTAPSTAPRRTRCSSTCRRSAPPTRAGSAATLIERGHRFVDAPVTGSAPKAQDGTLTIMAGGSEDDVRRAMPLFEAMGELIVHVGELGTGQQVKVISNAVAATNCATLAQGLVVGRRAGVDLEALLKVMGAGAANSTMLQLKGKPMLEHDFTPLFKLEHMLKDIVLCLRGGARGRRRLPVGRPGRRALRGGRRPRPRRAGLRRRARGGRGAQRHEIVIPDTHFSRMSGICRGIW